MSTAPALCGLMTSLKMLYTLVLQDGGRVWAYMEYYETSWGVTEMSRQLQEVDLIDLLQLP